MFDAAPAHGSVAHQGAATISANTGCRLDDLLTGPVVTFSPGMEIYAEGDKSGALYQIAFGLVRIYRLLADGRRQICAFQTPGEIFGFESGAQRHFFADAVNQVGLRVLRPGSEAELSHELLKLALGSLDRAHDHLLTVGRNDAAGRVAAFLIELANRQDSRGRNIIDLPMSRADVADYLGLTIETVSRVLTKLKVARIIRLDSARHLDVLRWDALENMTA
jgi:CRP/FNR family nitrogen fixation transcriptional regulator